MALAACSGPSATAPDLPANALPGRAGPVLELDAETVSADARDPAELLRLVLDAGFAEARERSWTDPARGRRAQVRVLTFDGPEGADSYLGWLRAHAVDVIGTSEEAATPDLPWPSFLAVHEPSGCCPKEERSFLAAWRVGPSVISIEIRGRRLGGRDVEELTSALRAAVRA